MMAGALPLVVLAAAAALAQQTGINQALSGLPSGLKLREEGPQRYRFICDYFQLDAKGNVSSRRRYSGDYTRNLPGNKARWNNVTLARTKGLDDSFSAPEPREFMEDFSYPADSGQGLFEPEFFAGFPATAIEDRNLIWDTFMFELFGRGFFDKLNLNLPHRLEPSDIPLAGAGTFQNKQGQLTWIGISERNGQNCALIEYQFLFNKFTIEMPGFNFTGRSQYWGLIWVSLATKQIEAATLLEDVLAELAADQEKAPRIVNVFRKGVFERLAAR